MIKENLEPLLQIIHITDMHVVQSCYSHKLKALLKIISKVHEVMNSKGINLKTLLFLKRKLEIDTAPHFPFAAMDFEDFIESITIKEPVWSQLTTWLVFTGDLTTFGDDSSLHHGKLYLDKFSKNCKNFYLYGNHDEWPGDFPFFAKKDILHHHAKLIKDWFPIPCPHFPISKKLPGDNGEIQLYCLNTPVYSYIGNSLAFGRINLHYRKQLAELIKQNTKPNQHILRILVTHHPIDYNSNAKILPIGDLLGANRVLYDISNDIHLILSGHTHETYPDSFDNIHRSKPLQLVIGSLMQYDKYKIRGDYPHQCQIIRIYYSPSNPSQIVIKRLLAARHRRTSFGYEFVSITKSNKISEEIVINI